MIHWDIESRRYTILQASCFCLRLFFTGLKSADVTAHVAVDVRLDHLADIEITPELFLTVVFSQDGG